MKVSIKWQSLWETNVPQLHHRLEHFSKVKKGGDRVRIKETFKRAYRNGSLLTRFIECSPKLLTLVINRIETRPLRGISAQKESTLPLRQIDIRTKLPSHRNIIVGAGPGRTEVASSPPGGTWLQKASINHPFGSFHSKQSNKQNQRTTGNSRTGNEVP